MNSRSPDPLPETLEATARQEIGERADTVLTRGEPGSPAIARVVSQSQRGVGGRVLAKLYAGTVIKKNTSRKRKFIFHFSFIRQNTMPAYLPTM